MSDNIQAYYDNQGKRQTLTAHYIPHSNEEDRGRVKAKAASAHMLPKGLLQQIIAWARLHEDSYQHQGRIHFEFSANNLSECNNWHLAAICADRIARDNWQLLVTPQGAQGQLTLPQSGHFHSDEQQLPVFEGPWLSASSNVAADTKYISHLSELNQDSPPVIYSAQAHFPLNSADPQLLDLQVAVVTAPKSSHAAITVLNARDITQQSEVINSLRQARQFDPTPTNYHSLVTLPETSFEGSSYQLALVLADRIARGRDLAPPHGRLVATGKSNSWHKGEVEPVKGLCTKLPYLAGELKKGDRLLIPAKLLDKDNLDMEWLQSQPGIKTLGILKENTQFARLSQLPVWVK